MKIELRELSFSYPSSKTLFEKINLSIPARSWVSIIGDCGSGKSTLAKLMAGLLQPASGEIIYPWDDRDIPFGYLFQNPEDQFVHFNIEKELAFSLENRGVSPVEIAYKVETALKEIALWERRGESPNQLSGGEKQRLALAGMLIAEPGLLFLDEPSAYLDIPGQKKLIETIRALRRKGTGIVWITQEPREMRQADYIIRLRDGEVTFAGESKLFFQENGVNHA